MGSSITPERIGYFRERLVPVLQSQGIEKGLERGPGLAGCEDLVDVASGTVRESESVDPGQDGVGGVIHHQSRAVGDAPVREIRDLGVENPLHPGLKRRIQRRPDGRGTAISDGFGASHEANEVAGVHICRDYDLGRFSRSPVSGGS